MASAGIDVPPISISSIVPLPWKSEPPNFMSSYAVAHSAETVLKRKVVRYNLSDVLK
jgi:hypothetical protein